jgi:hypothetical protein
MEAGAFRQYMSAFITMRYDKHHLRDSVIWLIAEFRQNICHFLQGVTEEQMVKMMKDII